MHTNTRKLLLASGIALSMTPLASAIAGDTAAQNLVEARQETQIWTTYALNPYLRANDLKVTVHGDKATITGNVAEGVNKELAEQIALGVGGIRQVDNQIAVKADYSEPPQPSDRGYGEVIDDATITSAVKSKLLWSKHTDGLSTDVDTRRGKVTLTGTAGSKSDKALATRLALNTRGVASVDNQIVVEKARPGMAASAGKAGSEAQTDISDSWITTKVKSTFMYSSNVDGSDIAVSTTGGVVTLTGKVDSGAQRALAVELAGNVRGVKSVRSKGLTI